MQMFFNPMEQLENAVKLFRPLAEKGKILAITHGNHEARTYRKEGIDLSYLLAVQLGLFERYSATSALIFLRFGKSKNKLPIKTMLYNLYASWLGWW